MSDQISPQKAPSLGLPKGTETCKVSIVNTTCDIRVPPPLLVQPAIKGHEWLNLPTFSFHITHESTGKQLLFDLGTRKDWENSAPPVADVLNNHFTGGMRITDDVHDILQRGGVDLNKLEAFVLSHWHFDHTGNPAALPKSVDLIVGPGFSEAFLPGWPSNEKSAFHEADFEGRKVVEVPFSDNLKIGRFQAFDYFGDGSFTILNVPGHAVGHISALVRTTEDTFIFLGGDVCHFGGSMRPTQYVPLPDQIPEVTPLDKRIPRPCPCSAFTICHPDQSNARTTPFYKVAVGGSSWYIDPPTAQKSIEALGEFDADPNVLVAIAHDPTYLNVFPFFPNGTLNDWKKNGLKEVTHWGFLNEMPYEGKSTQPRLVDGLYKDGVKFKSIE